MTQFTKHAEERLRQRGLTESKARLIITYGRETYTRGSVIYSVGKKEVDLFEEGVDLTPVKNWHVVTDKGGHVITAYKNADFASALKASPAKRKIRRIRREERQRRWAHWN